MEMTGQVYEISRPRYQQSIYRTQHFSTSTYLQPRTRYVSSTIFNLNRYNTIPIMYQDGTLYQVGQQSLPTVRPRKVKIYNGTDTLDTGRDDDYEGDHYYGRAAVGNERRWFWRDKNGHIYWWDDGEWNSNSYYNYWPWSRRFENTVSGPLPKDPSLPIKDDTTCLLLLILGYSFYRLKIGSNFYI